MTALPGQQVFNPKPAPICEKCDRPLGFVRLPTGKWRPCNPDGSDHWDLCRDVRYAKAMEGEMVEEVVEREHAIERIVYWNGGKKPFIVRHSIKERKQPKGPFYDGDAAPWENAALANKEHDDEQE